MSVSGALEKTRADGRSALVGYYPAGFPTVEGSITAVNTMIDAGCDIIEIGLPYSDPVMDGAAIQRAAATALAAGTRTRDVLRVVEAVSGRGVPILIMTYWNPVEKYGVDSFARDLAAAGCAGLITPDLIPEEADDWLSASDDHGLDRIFLVAPSSTAERISRTVDVTRGFVYAQSIMGVTGVRDTTSGAAPDLVTRTRRATDLPIGVGLGVRSREQAAEVAEYADAVIVGSALISCLLENPDESSGLNALRGLTAELAAGVGR
ncbi:MAG TPA: tryptophan synthase subunit alpha [Candidatus Stackebrandtia excrementipullorum]|nr:tryptophan synthase subunit alpha [Candidatus Stackebrandtia excrementipullorum]